MLTDRDMTMSLNLTALPNGLGYVVERCLQHDLGDRYSSIAELRRDFGMFTTQTELLEAPAQAAKRLIEGLAGKPRVDRDSVWKLHMIFADNLDDEILLQRAFVQLPENVVDAYVRHFPAQYREVLGAYDDAVSGNLPFEYCDVVARFYSKLYARFSDAATRRLLLGRLLDIGVSHNRFFVMDVVAKMLAAIKDPAEAAVARDVLLQHPYECRNLKDRLLSEVRLPILRQAIKEAAQQRDHDLDTF
jgi:hypothetical protein